VSNSIRQYIVSAEVHDTGVNCSDHILIIFSFRWSLNYQAHQAKTPKKAKHPGDGISQTWNIITSALTKSCMQVMCQIFVTAVLIAALIVTFMSLTFTMKILLPHCIVQPAQL